MSHPSSQPQTFQRSARDLAIDWEDMPSLAHLVGSPGASQPSDRVWHETMPIGLDELVPATWVRDCVPGLDVHETHEPEIFRLFFDAPHEAAPSASR